MQHRLMVEAPGAPRTARFLHVVQGADGSTAPDALTLIRGTAYEGAIVGATGVVFPITLGRNDSPVTIAVPGGVSRLLVTGLDKNAGYRVERRGGDITVTPGGETRTDGGGVLAVTI